VIADRGLTLLGQLCDELKAKSASLLGKASSGFSCTDRPTEKVDLLMKTLCSVYTTLEEVKEKELSRRIPRGGIAPDIDPVDDDL
jgi:hypothetical protein